MGLGQVGVNRHIQPWWAPFNPAQNQMLHRIKTDSATFQCAGNTCFNIRHLEYLKKPQNLNELALALFTYAGF